MAYYDKLVSAVYNDVVSGLRGISSNPTMSLEQLADDAIDERLTVLKEFQLKGVIPMRDLLMSINCIPVDCQALEKCPCGSDGNDTLTAHFEIPQMLMEYAEGIWYIGTTDKMLPFIFYTSPVTMMYHKYRKRGRNKPWVYVDITPNHNNMWDCFLFNAPLIKQVSVIGVIKDPRQLDAFGCCEDEDISNLTFIDTEVKKRLTEKKLRYYRQFAAPLMPNDQAPR